MNRFANESRSATEAMLEHRENIVQGVALRLFGVGVSLVRQLMEARRFSCRSMRDG